MQAPVMVMNTNSKRESGRKAQLANIQAAKVLHLKASSGGSSLSIVIQLRPSRI